jgi:hypothetical protein
MVLRQGMGSTVDIFTVWSHAIIFLYKIVYI